MHIHWDQKTSLKQNIRRGHRQILRPFVTMTVHLFIAFNSENSEGMCKFSSEVCIRLTTATMLLTPKKAAGHHYIWLSRQWKMKKKHFNSLLGNLNSR